MSDENKAYQIVNSLKKVSLEETSNLIVDQNLRIAALEAQNKRLVEALGTTNAALIVTADDLSRHGGYAGNNVYEIVTASRALLAEVTK